VTDVVVSALGIPVAIETRDEVEAQRLRRQWSRALTEGPPLRTVRGWQVADDVAGDYALTSAVTMAALEETAGHRINLHAGGVADAEGRLLVVVGSSGGGKTTAVHALGRHLGYLSDETVSLLPDGPPYVALPHAKPLSVITDPARPARKEQVSPDEAGLGSTPDLATLRRLVLLRRARDGQAYDEHGLVVVPIAEGVVELISQTSSITLLPHPLLTLAELLRSVGGAVVLEYEEIADHVDDLCDLLELDLDCEDPPTEHAPGSDGVEPGPGRWARGPWRDAVRLGPDVLVMVGSDVYRLDGLGAALWWAADGERTIIELVQAAEAELGAHPESARLVEEALAALSGSGLVRLGS